MNLSESSSFRPSIMTKRVFNYFDLLRHARAIASAMLYLHEQVVQITSFSIDVILY